MPTKVTVGLRKKLGLPDDGSIGASCCVELELDAATLDNDPETFRQRVRRAYAACRESVESELARDKTSHRTEHETTTNGHQNGTRRAATQSQIRAIHAIAGRNRIDLAPILDRFHVRSVAGLSIGDASSIIDELKGEAASNSSGQE